MFNQTIKIDEIEKELGQPALILKPTTEELEKASLSDDIADEYRVFWSKEAAGGCIVYGLYKTDWYPDPNGRWAVNPSGRWIIAELIRRLQANQ